MGLDRAAMIAAVTRRYPLFSGCATLANHRWMKRLVPDSDDRRWARSPGGQVRVSLSDFVGRSIFFFGDLDPKITWAVRRLLAEGDQAFDIGANIGVVTLLMSKTVGRSGVVHAFEPNPVLCADIADAIAFNHADNVHLHCIALSSCNSTAEIHVPESNSGKGSFYPAPHLKKKTHLVSTVRLDDLAIQSPAGIALMKIDVEGAEPEVLDGAEKTLAEVRPRAIILEVAHRDPSTDRAAAILCRHDYDYLALPRSLFRMRADRSLRRESHDIVAAPKGKYFNALCAKRSA
jgi:FkbM family methyltransferase